MLFASPVAVAPGTVGVAPGSLTMHLGATRAMSCPPDPVWRYFPSPFEPYTYFQPPRNPKCVPAPVINVTPPNLPPTSSGGPRTGQGSTIHTNSYPPRSGGGSTIHTNSDEEEDHPRRAATSSPNTTPLKSTHFAGGCVGCMAHAPQYAIPYADPIKLSGLRGLASAPGPFGMSWAGFLGVVSVALAGGVGLGWLSRR